MTPFAPLTFKGKEEREPLLKGYQMDVPIETKILLFYFPLISAGHYSNKNRRDSEPGHMHSSMTSSI
jgi:hypothetical protein